MANLSGCQNCQRSGIAILSGFLHLQAHLESSKTTSIKLEEFCQNLAETHSTSDSIIQLIRGGVNGVKEQKRKKVKLPLWKTETLQAPVPRPLVENWEQRDLCCFPSFYLGFQQVPRDQCAYHQCQQWHSSAHTRLGIYKDNRSQWECAAGRRCVWATNSLKVSSLNIILSGVVLLTAAVSWQPLSLQLQGPELNEFPIKNGLCISKDMPIADAASPCSLFSL